LAILFSAGLWLEESGREAHRCNAVSCKVRQKESYPQGFVERHLASTVTVDHNSIHFGLGRR
jgi:hypothetical protein